MLWMGDVHGKCLYLNRTLREFWGVAPEEVAGFDWSTSLHPDDAQAIYPVFGQAMREHAPFTVEARYRRHDGEYRLVRTDAQPRFDASGEFLGMIGVNVDITETRLAEQSLKESEERFRLIANSAPVPMWVSRLDGKRAFVNQAYMDFLGVGYEECLVYDWRKALHPDDRERILGEQIAGEGSRKPFALEARFRRGDGEWRWLRSESQPRWGPVGEHVGFVGVAHDITAAKQAETELRRLNETLEEQVEARTRERDRIWNVSQDIWWSAIRTACGSMPSGRDGASRLEQAGWSAGPRVDQHPDDIARSRAGSSIWPPVASPSGSRTACAKTDLPLVVMDGHLARGLIYATRGTSPREEAAETLRLTEERCASHRR
jgi:PAS domain S-box-containing protein